MEEDKIETPVEEVIADGAEVEVVEEEVTEVAEEVAE
jgi:hypothetical protein